MAYVAVSAADALFCGDSQHLAGGLAAPVESSEVPPCNQVVGSVQPFGFFNVAREDFAGINRPGAVHSGSLHFVSAFDACDLYAVCIRAHNPANNGALLAFFCVDTVRAVIHARKVAIAASHQGGFAF